MLTIIKNTQLDERHLHWKVWCIWIYFSLAPAYTGRMSIKTPGTAGLGTKQLELIRDLWSLILY